MAQTKKNGKSSKKEEPKIEPPKKKSAFDAILYVIAFSFISAYGAFVYDKTAFTNYAKTFTPLQPLVTVFEKVEEFSPFVEFLEDDHWASEPQPPLPVDEDYASGERIMTREELKKYDGSEGSPGIYLAILGQVFDVSKAPQFYGPSGGYGFFAGKDASRAYVSGEFDDDGLIDDVSGLSNSDYNSLDEWIGFYHKDYKYVGKLIGRYFNSDGSPTENNRKLQEWFLEAKEDSKSKENEKKIFPPCNSEWSPEKGQRVWCTPKSGGIERKWVGVPRRLFFPGRTERCACVKTSGKSLFNPASKSDNGDLDNPHLKMYDQCDPQAASCQVKEAEKK